MLFFLSPVRLNIGGVSSTPGDIAYYPEEALFDARRWSIGEIFIGKVCQRAATRNNS
jgi:hypothetical protein